MIVIILFLLILFYLYLIKPNTSRKELMKPYEEVYIAHRGLFNNIDVPENSIPAFQKAVANGYGIELDVQLTTDNKLVVYHDESLLRISHINKILNTMSYEELKDVRLLSTNEPIPLLDDVLKVLDKTTPLIIEIKPEGRYLENVKLTCERMKHYDGLYNIESFNPYVVQYLKENEPSIIRGQLAYNYLKDKHSSNNRFVDFVCTYLLYNFKTRPDYIAYDVKNMSNLSFRIVSKLFKGECVAWTVKSQEQLVKTKPYYQQFIFDSFIPKH